MKRLAAYIRQSLNDPSSSSPERQLEVIENWAKAHGYVIVHIYQDLGGKRSESENVKTRKEFQKLLKDADAKKFDMIVVSSQERFGTSGIYEFMGYMGRFLDLGIEVWDAGNNKLLNPHCTEATGILQSTIGSIVDTSEQMTRSRNTVTGQTTKARKGNYLGGPIGYGVAIRCVAIDGVQRWTSEMVGKKLYETQYADGRTTILPYTPCGDRAPTDELLFCRSRYPDRIWVIKYVFESFLAGDGARKIVGSLNKLGYRLPGGRLFHNSFVRNAIVNGYVYTGRVAYFKVSTGKFYQGNKVAPVQVKNLKGKSRSLNSIEEWLISKEVFEPIISVEDFHRAHNLLISKSRPRVRQNPMAVYAGILVCDNCGCNMTANKNSYCCTTYLNKGGKSSGCYYNGIASSVIDQYVNSWLEETGNILAWTVKPDPIVSLYKTAPISDRIKLLMVIVEHYLADKLSQIFPCEVQSDGSRIFEIPGQEIIDTAEDTEIIDVVRRVVLPGYDGDPSYLQELLGTVEASVNANTLSNIAKLEARKSHLLNIYPEADNRSLREHLLREINSIDSQIMLARVV